MNHLVKRSAQAVTGLLAGTAALTAILVGTDTAGATPSSPRHDAVTVVRTTGDGAGGGSAEPGTAEAVGTPAGDAVEPVTVTPVGPVDDPGPVRPGTAVPVGKPDTSTTTGGHQGTLPATR